MLQKSIFTTRILRSAYFKTALNTDVGSHRGEKVIDVRECHPLVLEMVVNFMYDIDLPEDFNFQDFEGVLFMADFYHMEDLKDAVSSHVSKHWNETNILALSQLAEKYKAEKMQEMCCDYILVNLDILGKSLLDQLFMALPLLGRKSWDRLNDTMPRGVEIANKVLGINLSAMVDNFTPRKNFLGDTYQARVGYEAYVRAHIKQDMLVVCNKTSDWRHYQTWNTIKVQEGTIGRVIECGTYGQPVVKWETGEAMRGEIYALDLLTPPVKTTLFS